MIKISLEQKQLIENSIIAVATSDLKNRPNVISIDGVKVFLPNQILITDNFMNKTCTNLRQNPQISLAVWNQDGSKAFQFKGTAEYLTSGKYKDIVIKDKNNLGLAHKAAVLITVKEIWDLYDPKLICKE